MLGFIGIKMLLPLITKILGAGFEAVGFESGARNVHHFEHIPVVVALGFVAVVLLSSVAASLIWPKPPAEDDEE